MHFAAMLWLYVETGEFARWWLSITGAAVDYTEGFVGCMRALQVNGEMLDMMGKVERGEVTYGVSAGLSISKLFSFSRS